MFYCDVVPRFFLNSYRPLQLTSGGRAAASGHGIAPYIDASCRREPDFEARWPTITALCRRTKFAPRLHVGDRVAYMTVKFAAYWRLVGLFTVEQRDETYRCGPCSDRRTELRQWDEHYRERSEECGVVLACRVEFLDLCEPPLIAPEDWQAWIGKRPQTRAGLEIDERLWRHLERRAHGN